MLSARTKTQRRYLTYVVFSGHTRCAAAWIAPPLDLRSGPTTIGVSPSFGHKIKHPTSENPITFHEDREEALKRIVKITDLEPDEVRTVLDLLKEETQ